MSTLRIYRFCLFTMVLPALVLAQSALFQGNARADEPMPKWGICAHRGARTEYPENTVPAFEQAARLGAQMIEFDACFTKDHVVVLLHDDKVDRTSNGTGNLYEKTFDEVRALDFGSYMGEQFAGTKIPTLEEALAVMPRNVWLNIHITQRNNGMTPDDFRKLAVKVADAVVADGRERQAFLATDHLMADAILAKYPQFLICNMERQGGASVYVNDTIERKCQFIQIARPMVTPGEVKRLKDAGIAINFFGTNDPEEMRELIAQGVDFPLVDNVPLGMETYRQIKGEKGE